MGLKPLEADKGSFDKENYKKEIDKFWSHTLKKYGRNKVFDEIIVSSYNTFDAVWDNGILSGHKKSVFAACIIRYACLEYSRFIGSDHCIRVSFLASFFGVTEPAIRLGVKSIYRAV